MNKKIIYIDLDGVVVDLIGEMQYELENTNHSFEDPTELIDQSETIFLNAKPIPHALEAIIKLEKHFDVYILSTAPWHNIHAWSQKRIWVEKYLPSMYKKLILTHHKNQLMGDYLIDDRLKNGVSDFKGEHIHIFQEKYPTWESVLNYLITNNEYIMNDKFKNIPTDKDTKIISELQTKFGTLDCVLQTWFYDGIQGTSLIFLKTDLENTTSENIKNEIKKSDLLKDLESTITFSLNPKHEYVFFNFNFVEEEF